MPPIKISYPSLHRFVVHGRAVALSIPTPSSRFERQKAMLGKKILAVRKRIADALGTTLQA